MRCSWSRRFFRKMPLEPAPSRLATARLPGSGPTGWIATFCTGPAVIRWRRQSLHSNNLSAAGKILSWGVSNFDVTNLEAVLKIAGEGNLACNQVLYHLGERAIERAVIPWCEKHDVAVVAYSPFGHSSFPGPRTTGGCLLKQIADAHKATVRQVALRFLVRRPSVFAIPKSSNAEHVTDNAGTVKLELTEAEVAQIGEAFPLGPPAGLPML